MATTFSFFFISGGKLFNAERVRAELEQGQYIQAFTALTLKA